MRAIVQLEGEPKKGIRPILFSADIDVSGGTAEDLMNICMIAVSHLVDAATAEYVDDFGGGPDGGEEVEGDDAGNGEATPSDGKVHTLVTRQERSRLAAQDKNSK